MNASRCWRSITWPEINGRKHWWNPRSLDFWRTFTTRHSCYLNVNPVWTTSAASQLGEYIRFSPAFRLPCLSDRLPVQHLRRCFVCECRLLRANYCVSIIYFFLRRKKLKTLLLLQLVQIKPIKQLNVNGSFKRAVYLMSPMEACILNNVTITVRQ